jgi:predicted transcriptional regulator of viral defense system
VSWVPAPPLASDGAAPSPADRRLEAAVIPIRATHRTMRVLGAIESIPRLSNREIAEIAGLTDDGQTSRLLGRLERRGLIENVGLGAPRGEPNAWLLTPYGHRVVKTIGHPFALGATAQRNRIGGSA